MLRKLLAAVGRKSETQEVIRKGRKREREERREVGVGEGDDENEKKEERPQRFK